MNCRLQSLCRLRTLLIALTLALFPPMGIAQTADSNFNSPRPTSESWLLFGIRQSGELKGYIFGTAHTPLGTNSLPATVKAAVRKSHSFVLESNYFDKDLVQQAQATLASNPNGQSLEKLLSPATFNTLQQLYDFKNIPPENRAVMNLWSPYLVIFNLEAECSKQENNGIMPEQVIYRFAVQHNMKILGMENVEDQMGWLSKLNATQWDDYFRAYSSWIQDKNCNEKFNETSTKIWKAMLNGDADSIFDEYMRFYSHEIPVSWFQDKYFLTARNIPLAEKIKDVLKSEPMPFFSVGAAHLGGPNGLLHLLRSSGFEVTQE